MVDAHNFNGNYNTSWNYCAMFAHKCLCTNACNLGSILLNIDAATFLTCSRDSPMEDDDNHIIFVLIGQS